MADFAVIDVCDNTNSYIEFASIWQYAADVMFFYKSRGRRGALGIFIAEIFDHPKYRSRKIQERIKVHRRIVVLSRLYVYCTQGANALLITIFKSVK